MRGREGRSVRQHKPHGRSNLSLRNQVQEDKKGIGEEWHAGTRAADTRMEKNG